MKKREKSFHTERNVSTLNLLTPQEVCARLRISRPTLVRLIAEKKLSAVRVGVQWRISEESLENFVVANHSQSSAA